METNFPDVKLIDFNCIFQKVTSAKPSAKKPSLSAMKGRKKKKEIIKYTIDCTHPVEDGIMDIAAFVSTSFLLKASVFQPLAVLVNLRHDIAWCL